MSAWTRQRAGWVAVWLALPNLLVAATEADSFLGRWSGRYRGTAGDEGLFQAQVIPQGGASYHVWVRMGERGSRYRVEGRRTDGVLQFAGRFQFVLGTDDASYDLTGEIRGDVFSGRYESAEGNGIVQLARVRTAPAPLAAPPGATVLFGEKWPEFWREPATWPKEGDGVVVASGPDLVSRTTMRGFRLGLEFLLPLLPEARGDDRARSGVAVGEALEVRIVDSFGAEPTVASCGALVGVAAPRVDAALPPLEWQTLDIILTPLDSPPPGRTAPGRAEVTVLLNGEMLHERRLVENHVPGPLRLRSTGSAVRFRRGWLVAEATDMSR